MLNYTRITNVSFVDQPNGPRLWANFILIDEPKKVVDGAPSFDNIRQIRGFTNGGLTVFTYWIKPDEEVKFEEADGEGSFTMLRENRDPVQIGNNMTLTAGDLVLKIALSDHEQPMDIRNIEVESCPGGSIVDEEILKYYKAPGYCVTTYVAKEEALELARKLDSMRR